MTASPGPDSRPIDLAVSGNGRYLYTLNGGNQTISAFQVRYDGALAPIAANAGIPVGANGLAAR